MEGKKAVQLGPRFKKHCTLLYNPEATCWQYPKCVNHLLTLSVSNFFFYLKYFTQLVLLNEVGQVT